MDRRHFSSLATAVLAGVATTPRLVAHDGQAATPTSAPALLTLTVEMTDEALVVPPEIPAGLTELTVTNSGTNPATHWLMARIALDKTFDQVETFFASEGESSEIDFERDLEFVGVPDWPPAGGSVSGVVNISPGTYLLLDIYGGRGLARTGATGEPPAVADPAADLTVTLKDMIIDLPDTAFSAEPRRWRIDNVGSIQHDVAVVPVDPDLTEEDFLWLLSLPEDATPTLDGPWIDYQPVAAIGVLASGATSWLDVQLAPGRYLAVCMLPFGTGYPHAMDGMLVFFDVV